MDAAWQSGDRHGAMAAIPDAVLRDLVVFGSPAKCAASVARYLDAGPDVVTLALLPEVEATDPVARVELLVQVAGERRTQDSGVARP